MIDTTNIFINIVIPMTVFVSVTGHVAYFVFITRFFYYPFCISFARSKPLSYHSCGSSLDRVTQTFTPKGSGPLVGLPKSSWQSYTLILIPGRGDTKRHPQGPPVYWTDSSYHPGGATGPFPLVVRTSLPNQHNNSHLCLLIQRHKEPELAKWQF